MKISDHVPCLVKISTDGPKGSVFRFENYWMEHEDCLAVVQHGWNLPIQQTDAAKEISAKFKNLRSILKAWSVLLSNLKENSFNVKLVLSLLEILEEYRDLSIQESNFKEVLSEKLLSLLRQQKIYWKQRGTIKWVKFGYVVGSWIMTRF